MTTTAHDACPWRFTSAFSAGDDRSSAFDYDATGQLIAADHTAQTDEEFEFDENGNRTMSGYVTGDNNLVLSDGEFDYLYDAEGNRIRRTRISSDPADDYRVEYEWDHRNRLSAVFFKNNQGTFTAIILYEYDVFNRRTRKIIDRDGAGEQLAEQIDFIYDGQNIVLALDGEGSLTNRYLHGPGVDQILVDEQIGAAGTLWTLTDNQGSVRDLVENYGDVASHIDYTAFGKVETETQPSVRTLYGWTGRERDTETGLNFHRARYYDPVIGRWISEDPIGFDAGDTNITRLTHNDPINFVDADGKQEKSLTDTPESWLEREDSKMWNGAERPMRSTGTTPAQALDERDYGLNWGDSRGHGHADQLGDGHVGLFVVAVYEEIADQLENLIIELATCGTGYLGMAAVEAIESGWWIFKYRKYFLRFGDGNAIDITDQYNALQRQSKADNAAVQDGIQRFADDVAGAISPPPSGQIHHPISTKVGRALDSHPTLRGHYQPRDPRFTTQACDDAAHRGYQTWHRELDAEVVEWIENPDNIGATPQQFESWLRSRYSQPDLSARFPNGF